MTAFGRPLLQLAQFSILRIGIRASQLMLELMIDEMKASAPWFKLANIGWVKKRARLQILYLVLKRLPVCEYRAGS